MSYMVWIYIGYIVLSVVATVWIGRTLSRRGRYFLGRRYDGQQKLADPMSDLLAVGFYVLHTGFALLVLRYGGQAGNLPESIEVLSTKIGIVLAVLAASHFAHLGVYSRLRSTAAKEVDFIDQPEEASIVTASTV